MVNLQLDIGGVWHISIFVICFLVLIKIFYDMDLDLFPKLLWAYVLTKSLYILEYPSIQYGHYQIAYQAMAGQVFVEAVLIPLGAWLCRSQILKFLPCVVIYELACVWTHKNGLLMAPSFNSAFATLAIPFLPWWAILCVLGTILTHHGSTALLILGAQLLAYLVKDKTLWKPIALIMVLLLGAAYFHHNGPWFDSTERLQKYFQFMTFWTRDWKWILFGVGPGSFLWTSVILDEFKGNLFLQMHSDWLQIIWELGLVGFTLTLGVFVTAIRRAWNSTQLLSALFGAAAFGLTYHPLRWGPTALLIAVIFL